MLAVTDLALKEAPTGLATGVFKALGSRDYGWIDMRLDAQGVPAFIEANLMPGLSDHGYLRRCFSLNGQPSYDNMVLAITDLASERATSP